MEAFLTPPQRGEENIPQFPFIFSMYRRKRTALGAGLESASAASLKSLKKLKASVEALANCSICYDFFEVGVSTPCGHTFCRSCLLMHADDDAKKCPICNKELAVGRLPFFIGRGHKTRLQTQIARWPESILCRGVSESVRAAEFPAPTSSLSASRLLRFLHGSEDHEAFNSSRAREIIESITDVVDVNAQDAMGRSLLWHAAAKGSLGKRDVLEMALDLSFMGGSLSQADKDGVSPFMLFARGGIDGGFTLFLPAFKKLLASHSAVRHAREVLRADLEPAEDLLKAFLHAAGQEPCIASGIVLKCLIEISPFF